MIRRKLSEVSCSRWMLRILAVPALWAAFPAWAQLPAPSAPILVIQDSSSSDPYQNFIPELLTTEGLNEFQTAQLSQLTATFLSNYDVAVLPHLALTAAQTTLLQNYVGAGGTLIGFRPDPQLAGVFGVSGPSSTLADAWMKINVNTAIGSGLANQVIKFHGTADLYSLQSAKTIAALYQNSVTSTAFPAVAVSTFGQGQAILFSFDLSQSVVLMRQGNPAWAGYPNNHDGFNTMRPAQMFMDVNTGAFWNDLGDNALNDVPQADEQLRLFSNAMIVANAAKRPLPRLWYFPNQARSVLLMTGDQHGDAESNSTSEINAVEAAGGLFSEFLWFPFGSTSTSTVAGWLASGNSMGIHFDDTAEADSSGVPGSKPTWAGMQSVLNNAITSFTSTYPSAPFPSTTRNHFLIWTSNAADGSVDQTAQAELFQNAGVKIDTTYSSFPRRWGYMTGSGLPMKFLNPKTGNVIPVYEQATQYEDDIQLLNANGFGLSWDLATATAHYQQSLSESVNKYNTVVTMLFHPDEWIADGHSSFAAPVLQYAQNQSIPMPSLASWLAFWQGRAATAVSSPTFASNTLSFTTSGGPAGLTLEVPDASAARVVSSITVDGASQNFTTTTNQGIVYANVTLAPGNHSVAVNYAAAGTISGQISPAAAAASTVVTVQSGAIALTVQPASDGTYSVGPFPAGTYTVTPSSASYSFNPSSQSVTLGTANVTGINFSGTPIPPMETLFTTQLPANQSNSDGASTNYELGTVFTSAVTGNITAVRFWKSPSETGTHTGHIWNVSGQLLASVTFSSESGSGWQQQALSTPLAIAAGTQYVVSVNTGSSFYVSTGAGLASQITNQDLSTVVGNNGRFGSPGQFPTNSFNNTNYFRDIVFTPTSSSTGALIQGQITPVPAALSAQVQVQSGSNTQIVQTASDGTFSAGPFAAGTYTVTPISNAFSFSPASLTVNLGTSNSTGVNFTGSAPIGGGETLFTTQIPLGTNNSDGSSTNYELGTVFVSASAGNVTGIRFWKSSRETGTHTGNLWSASGQLLASVIFNNETPSGWQQQNLASPLAIAAGTHYVVSVNTGGTFYTASGGGLASQVTNQDLSSVVGNNGVFGSPGQFPTGSFNNTNYFRDVAFTAGGGGASGAQIQGQITPIAAASGTTIKVTSGSSIQMLQPASDGTYSTGQLAPGTYTITPVSSAYAFSPVTQSVTLGSSNATGVNFAGTAAETLFTTQTPATTNNSDGSTTNYELGTVFTSSVAGNITAIRFWKSSSETGTHVGNIWNASGQLLASVTFADETASGWQQQSLATPLAISAGTQYVVSVNTGATFYVATSGGLASQITNQDLSSVVGSNGLFGSPGQFPNNTFNRNNYFRDVLMIPSR